MTSNKPKITLKGLKIAKFASEETLCYEATVYIDGKALCIASNQGHGGDTSFDAIRPRGGYKTGEEAGAARRKLDAEVHKIALRHNPNAIKKWPEGGFPDRSEPWEEDDAKRHAAHDLEMAESDRVTTWQVFEHLVDEALTRAEYEKDLKRLLTRRAVFINDAGEISNTKQVPKAHWENGAFLDTMRKKFPDEKLMNDLPFDEALDRFIGAV